MNWEPDSLAERLLGAIGTAGAMLIIFIISMLMGFAVTRVSLWAYDIAAANMEIAPAVEVERE